MLLQSGQVKFKQKKINFLFSNSKISDKNHFKHIFDPICNKNHSPYFIENSLNASNSLQKVLFSELINEIFQELIKKSYLLFVLGGFLLFFFFLCFSYIYICGRSKSKRVSQNPKVEKIKLIVLKQPISSATHHSQTSSQNEETPSLTNILIDNEFVRPTLKKSDDKNKVNKEKQEKLDKTKIYITKNRIKEMSSDISNNQTSEFLPKDSALINSFFDKINYAKTLRSISSVGNEINKKAIDRIKKFIKDKSNNVASNESEIQKPESYIKHSEHQIISNFDDKSKQKLIYDSRDKEKNQSIDKSIDESDDKLHNQFDDNLDEEIKIKINEVKNILKVKGKSENSENKSINSDKIRKIQKCFKNRKKSDIKTNKKKKKWIFGKSIEKKQTNKTTNENEFDFSEIKIYHKTIELKEKSDKLVCLLNQIPSLEGNLPNFNVLYNPPSLNTLKKGKQIIDIEGSSEDSSEDLLNYLKKFKEKKSKIRLKTKSTEPILDGEIYN